VKARSGDDGTAEDPREADDSACLILPCFLYNSLPAYDYNVIDHMQEYIDTNHDQELIRVIYH
jgi:hypothetical protein